MKPSSLPSSISSHCGICQGPTAIKLEESDRHGMPLRVVICDSCGVVHNDPIPSPDELQRFYSEEYRSSYKGTHEPRLRHAARYFRSTAQHIHDQWSRYEKAETVLDIGSGSGEFLFLMQKLGKSVWGLEPSITYSEFCRTKLSLNITTGEIDSFVPPVAFDHIRLCHVVEHLRDPVGQLRRISNWLSPEGTLYVEVPDFKSYCRSKSPGGIFHYGHIYNFDADSFDHLVSAAGLRLVSRTGPTSAFLSLSPTQDPPVPATPARLEATYRLYEAHRNSKRLSGFRFARICNKLRKTWNEYRLISSKPGYVLIGESTAHELHQRVRGGFPAMTMHST